VVHASEILIQSYIYVSLEIINRLPIR